jgi:hypothetical protein
VALGSQAFLRKVKDWVGRVGKEQPTRTQVLKRVSPEDVRQVVERRRGEGWAQFSNRHGDWGRELVLYLVRRRSGLTLGEIGQAFGIVEYKTVAAAIKRFETSLTKKADRKKMVEACLSDLSKMET